LNNVCPTIMRQPARDVAFGLRGGRRIVSVDLSLAQQLLQGRSVSEAVRAPRLHNEGYDPIQVTESMPAAIRGELEKMGHIVTVTPAIAGAANSAEIGHDGTLRAAGTVFALGVG
jgi:gamma-glutamyltranspeptidase/glutathione hydrolase